MMFRLMVFNVLTQNKDDHSKNFSFILKEKNWKLSPSYDLVLSNGFNREHTTTVMGNGNPTKKDMFDAAKETGLPKKRIVQIYEDVYENSREIVKKYYNLF